MTFAQQTRERNNYWRKRMAESDKFIRENCLPISVEESRLCPICSRVGTVKQDGYWYCVESGSEQGCQPEVTA